MHIRSGTCEKLLRRQRCENTLMGTNRCMFWLKWSVNPDRRRQILASPLALHRSSSPFLLLESTRHRFPAPDWPFVESSVTGTLTHSSQFGAVQDSQECRGHSYAVLPSAVATLPRPRCIHYCTPPSTSGRSLVRRIVRLPARQRLCCDSTAPLTRDQCPALFLPRCQKRSQLHPPFLSFPESHNHPRSGLSTHHQH